MKCCAYEMFKLIIVLLFILKNNQINGKPSRYDEYLPFEGDMISVGSLRREVRQQVPLKIDSHLADLLQNENSPKVHEEKKKVQQNSSGKEDAGGFLKIFGNAADGEKGFVKKTFNKGDNGYKTHDTFHKRYDDDYNFEKHEVFGSEKKMDDKKQSDKSKTKLHDDHEGADTTVDGYYTDGEGDTAGYAAGDYDVDFFAEGDGNANEGEGGGQGGGDTGGYVPDYAEGAGASSGEFFSAEAVSAEGADY